MVPKYKWKKQPTIKDLCGISSCVEVKKKKEREKENLAFPLESLMEQK